MSTLIFTVLFGLGSYIFIRIMEKKPILPWKEPDPSKMMQSGAGKRKNENKNRMELDEEPEPFRKFLNEVTEINNHMLRYNDNTFVLIAEVDPVNYFLLSDSEQDAIDRVFETWLAQQEGHIQFYLQNRYIDLTDPIKEMQKNMKEADDLHQNALEYGESMVEDLIRWQREQPRFETKRYIIWTNQIKPSEITAEDKDELEKKIIEKAFADLFRRFNSAKQQLRKANMEVSMLTTEGLIELLYYTFNRRKAVKNRFRDLIEQEGTALYVTADQDDAHIERVREEIENESTKNDTNKEEKDKQSDKEKAS